MTITHDALHCTGSSVQGPRTCPLLLVTSRGKDCIPVQSCSLEDLTVQTPPPGLTSGGWLCMASGQAVHILLQCFLVVSFQPCSFLNVLQKKKKNTWQQSHLRWPPFVFFCLLFAIAILCVDRKDVNTSRF